MFPSLVHLSGTPLGPPKPDAPDNDESYKALPNNDGYGDASTVVDIIVTGEVEYARQARERQNQLFPGWQGPKTSPDANNSENDNGGKSKGGWCIVM